MVRRKLAGAVALAGSVVAAMTTAGAAAPSAAASAAECPASLHCDFVPAAYDWASADHSDPNNYGNYDPANRPADGNSIRYIVIHDTEESYADTLAGFRRPNDFATAHYVVRSSDGHVTQMVPNRALAWGVANWTMNQHSISIEHEGYAAQGNHWYTEAMYRSSATLVRYLAAKYHIPLDRQHIIAHEDVPGETDAKQKTQHWDPGPYWNWQHYMALLGAPLPRATGHAVRPGQVVTVDPDFATNRPPVTTCPATGPCTTLPAQGTNAVYLHSAPSQSSPLIGDPLIHTGAGTTKIDDWSDKAVTGHNYVVADRQGDWTALWFGGRKAWLYDPAGRVTVASHALTVSAPKGKPSVPVYGLAFPGRQAYPPAIPFDPSWTPTPLSWTLPAGQSYTVVEPTVASNYYARFDAAHVADNHTYVTDGVPYWLIDYNHRYAWVKVADTVPGAR